MQRSVHSVHATGRTTTVSSNGGISGAAFSATCATTSGLLTTRFRQNAWAAGANAGTSGDTTVAPPPAELVQDNVVRWKAGKVPNWWMAQVSHGRDQRWWRMVAQEGSLGNFAATFARPLCPSSPFFLTHCTDATCVQVTSPDIPSNLSNLGVRTLGSRRVWLLESVTTVTNSSATLTTTKDFYIQQSTLRLLRFVVAQLGVVNTGQQANSSLAVFNYSGFNTPVKIMIPKTGP